MRRLTFTLLLAVSLWAQNTTRSVIVRFRDDIQFDMYGRAAASMPFAEPEITIETAGRDPNVVALARLFESGYNIKSQKIFTRALRGFSAQLTDDQVRLLQTDSRVLSVRPDRPMYATTDYVGGPFNPPGSPAAQVTPAGVTRVGGPKTTVGGTRDLSRTVLYVFDSGVGTGIAANANISFAGNGHTFTYTVANHPDLQASIVQALNFHPSDANNADCNGHGTHVAGTSAAIDNSSYVVGVAPGLRIVSMKVLNCFGSGPESGVLAAVDWIVANHAATYPGSRPVVNMSLGAFVSNTWSDPPTDVENAIVNATTSAVKAVFALSAGNENNMACGATPARVGAGTNNGVVTVAATNNNANPAVVVGEPFFSNFGRCVDIWAPGVAVRSTFPFGVVTGTGGGISSFPDGMRDLQGTSMASPHVAAGLALLLSNPAISGANVMSMTGAQVETRLKADRVFLGGISKDGKPIRELRVTAY